MGAGCLRESKQETWKAKSGWSPASLPRLAHTGGTHGRHRLIRRRSVATFGAAEEVGRLTCAAARDLGAAEKILDWPHLGRKVQAAVRAVQPGKRPTRRAWRKAQDEVLLPLLWTGKRLEALAQLRGPCPASGEAPPAVEEAIRYLETQGDGVGNYAHWQEHGYPVGSGLVERAVALVINARMKKRGKRWKRGNATAVVALRVHSINAAWDAVA
jgi:hypothetical protein